ncbi:MAG TPA: plastocyanin/azurin family copper-binding protein [Egibacteraceae bacterium]|jgi:plastocyanin|nr:plastocyanin/azurin family copper-binding protein [Egibacteraceae bacterium]
MNQDFRERVFVPFMLPLAVLAGFGIFAFSLSRVLLAVPEMSAVFIALLVAAYVLVLAAFVAARPHLPARALGVGLVVGMVGVTAAGAAGAAAGIRPIHHEEEAAAEGEGGEGEGAEGEAFPEDALVFVAIDIDFSEAPATAPAGELTIAIDNKGGAPHDVTFEEAGDETVVEAPGGESATGTIELEPGTYTYYCSVPGHRQAGMEGTLEVQ